MALAASVLCVVLHARRQRKHGRGIEGKGGGVRQVRLLPTE